MDPPVGAAETTPTDRGAVAPAARVTTAQLRFAGAAAAAAAALERPVAASDRTAAAGAARCIWSPSIASSSTESAAASTPAVGPVWATTCLSATTVAAAVDPAVLSSLRRRPFLLVGRVSWLPMVAEVEVRAWAAPIPVRRTTAGRVVSTPSELPAVLVEVRAERSARHRGAMLTIAPTALVVGAARPAVFAFKPRAVAASPSTGL